MPAIIPFIPMLASLVGAGTAIWSGNKAQQQNNQVRTDQQTLANKQQGYFDKADTYTGGMEGLIGQYGQIGKDYNSGMGSQMGYLEGLKGQYGGLNNKLEGLDGQYGDLGKLLEGLSGKFGGLSGKLDGLDGQYGDLGKILEGLSGKFGNLEGDYRGQMGALDALFKQTNDKGFERADASGAISALMGTGNRLLSETSPDAYRAQAQLAGSDALDQIGADMASRGLGNSGVAQRTGSSTLSRLYADANVRYNSDRISAGNAASGAFGQAGQLGIGAANANNAAQQNLTGTLAGLLSNKSGLLNGIQGIYGAQAGIAGQQGNLLGARAGLVGQQGNFLNAQAGIAGQQGNLLGARAGLVGQQSGLLGQQQGLGALLAQLLGQSAGVNQGLVGSQLQGYQGLQNYNLNLAQIMAGKEASLNQNFNPNPYGGLGAAVGAFGNAAGAYSNNQQQAPLQQANADYYRWLMTQGQPKTDAFGNPIVKY